jgi:hypothetical protein
LFSQNLLNISLWLILDKLEALQNASLPFVAVHIVLRWGGGENPIFLEVMDLR